jgi:hypothetical protein
MNPDDETFLQIIDREKKEREYREKKERELREKMEKEFREKKEKAWKKTFEGYNGRNTRKSELFFANPARRNINAFRRTFRRTN